ncbi:MAG TPA: glycosyltransferase family 4 protein [Verrucomicrobium sp.]|nr:glycosyltransferase family 4 protein [Verrucomicrobium sp.]
MRILMTQRDLTFLGGTEMVTVELAKALAERGHEVAVYTPKSGRIANVMISSGVWVRDRLADLPWVPDIIHGQHHLQTMAALARFNETKAVYYCHGLLPWVERPPLHPRIGRYLMMCEWLVPRTFPEYGLPPERVVVLPNFVNLTRFTRVRTPPARPVRAALFGGDLPPDDLEKLEGACAACGLTLEKIGYQHENPLERPEIFLQGFDLVFAMGRCALEAMACGCAVVPLMPGQAGGLITAETFNQHAFSNFSPRYFITANQISAGWLGEQLALWQPVEVLAVTCLVRERHSLTLAVDRLLEFYQQALATPANHGSGASVSEFASYLESMGREADTLWAEGEAVRARNTAEALKSKAVKKALRQAEKENERLKTELATLEMRHDLTWQTLRESWMGRWVQGRVRRLLRHIPDATVRAEHKDRESGDV